MSIDLDRPRPLEIAILHHEEGGKSERELLRRSRVGADALFHIRVLNDADRQHTVIGSVDGHTGEPLALANLYRLWVSFAGHLARTSRKVYDGNRTRHLLSGKPEIEYATSEEAKELLRIERLCGMVVSHLSLNPDMTPRTEDDADDRRIATPGEAERPSVEPSES